MIDNHTYLYAPGKSWLSRIFCFILSVSTALFTAFVVLALCILFLFFSLGFISMILQALGVLK